MNYMVPKFSPSNIPERFIMYFFRTLGFVRHSVLKKRMIRLIINESQIGEGLAIFEIALGRTTKIVYTTFFKALLKRQPIYNTVFYL